MTLPIAAFMLGVKVGPDGCIYNTSATWIRWWQGFLWKTCTARAPTKFATLDPHGVPHDWCSTTTAVCT